MLKLTFYVPETHLEEVKLAIFNAGGGMIGNYDQCCWQVAGLGQFRPLEGSEPFLGNQSMLESVVEYRVELVVNKESAPKVKDSLIRAHPYEEPAYDFVQLVEID